MAICNVLVQNLRPRSSYVRMNTYCDLFHFSAIATGSLLKTVSPSATREPNSNAELELPEIDYASLGRVLSRRGRPGPIVPTRASRLGRAALGPIPLRRPLLGPVIEIDI